jgi:catechol 2,3-dioxygenase-like lactoylglutathione lyase family enzyme
MSIFDHISIKVGDMTAANAFYQAALEPLGIEQKFLVERPGGHTAGYGRDKVRFFIGNGATLAQGSVHLAFEARSRSEVDAFHAAALAAGGQDNGEPGLRPRYHDNYYAAFVIDPAGNNVEAVYQGAP